ncbi:P-loop containing nucleoside triphosphate hydrolase protein [Lasiosphaeria miniovina]|uniref:DNA 3'-5' helicase n=1 Tax=Lasiosphaeria miniovina TaxID=1954250 RepID=A0AA40A5K9_9PEZI|nr:P-loop containing nucleoside triphosphate hydrolase protein [Lasiosphaeria miniovina]KAK0709605.1 P-loop containing nucleoside triphosphate hydrolase protein [Lasiosphaeria miniovina]
MSASSERRNVILAKLNDAQSRAVRSKAPTVAILAGPGSGKTHTLTSRVVWLVDCEGFRPEDVVVATFTVKAAREMQERIGKALGSGREKKLVLGTFHSIARRYLAAYGRHIGLAQKFGIADDSDSRAIILRICKRLQLAIDPPAARAWISKRKAKGSGADSDFSSVGAQKLLTKTPAKTAGQRELETCYTEYQSQLERSNLLDYDDLLVRCVELLRKFPSCVSNVKTVLIDEYQDTNGVQYELMKLLAQKHGRITVVGDPDQSIYGWRSAEIRNLWRLLEDYPGAAEISLEENYRSSQSIVTLSLLVIQQDEKRYKKALKPVHNKGSRPVLRRLKNASTEAEWIVSEIRRAILMSGGMLTHNDVAVLLRSAALSRHVESALGKAGVAYRMVGGFKFYDRAEIKTVLDYLRVIHQPENNDALARIMNVPRRGIGEGTVKSLIDEAEKSSLSLWSLLVKHCRGDRAAKTKISKHAEQKISGGLLRLLDSVRKRIEQAANDSSQFGLVEIIQQLLEALSFQKVLQETHPDDHEQRWANVQEFISLANDFVRDLGQNVDDYLPEIDGVQQTKDVDALPRFLANVSLASDAQTKGDDQDNKPLVTLSTIHAAKGLEWPIVFVPAVYNGSIPHMRSEDNDEERRLLYVAMTRAQALLHLSCPLYSSNSNGERNELSPFVKPVAAAFAKKGPCFDRPVMSEIARILERQLPAEQSIYKGMPAMFSTEDSLFPLDPEETREIPAGGAARGGSNVSADASRPKRPRLYGPPPAQDTSEEPAWHKEYATTMEQSSGFTVSSLPGFVSAGTHQVALAAANAAAEASRKAGKHVRPSTNKRPADQKSIVGFIRTNSSSAGPAALRVQETTAITATGRLARPNYNPTTHNSGGAQRASDNLTRLAIEPELVGRKLGAGKLLTRPVRPDDGVGQNEVGRRKEYHCFSSSPTKPVPVEKGSEAVGETNENEPPPEPTRAAACLHATTYNMPKGLGGGLRRTVGLSRDSIAPMAKLRKPFKPLTISRP